MQAIKINIEGSSFLLPSTHSNYEFPIYISENKGDILKCVSAYEEWLKNPLQDMPSHPDMSEFKTKTGIIGIPFNAHAVELYILDRNVEVVSEVDL